MCNTHTHCVWTPLEPRNPFRGDLDPGAKLWVQGPFLPKFKNLQFSHKTPHYGCLWTPLDPSNCGDNSNFTANDICSRLWRIRGFISVDR